MVHQIHRFAAFALTAFPLAARAQDGATSIGPGWGEALMSAVIISGVLALAAHLIRERLRTRRREMRREISGLGNGPRFRVVDAMTHALMPERHLSQPRLARAVEIARDTTDMGYTKDHLTEMAARSDYLILPWDFRWMRDGLDLSEKLVIFNSVAAVMLADGSIVRRDRRLLRAIASGLRLKARDLRHLAHLIED